MDKLRRESIRLSQVQDIAGCRLVVANLDEQDALVAALSTTFPTTTVVDRREHPSHGYRAVHVIVNQDGKSIEIQVRTSLQHMWAEFSEKCSDLIDPTIKYGGGPDQLRDVIQRQSTLVATAESNRRRIVELETSLRDPEAAAELAHSLYQQLESLKTSPNWAKASESTQRTITETEAKIEKSAMAFHSLRAVHQELERVKAVGEDSMNQIVSVFRYASTLIAQVQERP